MSRVLDRYTGATLKALLIVLPPVLLFLSIIMDTVSTEIGLEVGLVEANPKYGHYNIVGVSPEDFFERVVMAAVISTVFLMSNVVVFEMGDIKGWWLFALVSLVLWIFLFFEMFIVYSNLVRIAVMLA